MPSLLPELPAAPELTWLFTCEAIWLPERQITARLTLSPSAALVPPGFAEGAMRAGLALAR